MRPSLVPVLLSRRAAIGGGAAPFDPADISGLLSRFLDTNPGYHGSTLGGLPILTPEESGTLARPRGQTCLSFDGINDQLTWTAANTGTQYVTYYNPATATWVSPVTLTHNGSAYVFAPGAIKATNLKRWSVASPTSGQIEAITLTAAQGSGGLVSWHWCNEESGTTTYDVANATPLNATLANGPSWVTDAGVTYNPANWLGHTVANNLLLRSQDFGNAWWPAWLSTKTTGITDPSGGTTAVSINYNANNDADIAQNVSLGSSSTYTLSVYARSATSKSFRLRYNNGAWIHSADIATTTSWARYSFTFTSSVAAIAFANNVAGTAGVVEFAFAQLEVGSTASPYAATTSTALTNVVIPRNESNTSQDAAGNALGVVGPVKHPATTEVRCVTGDGSAVNIALSDLSLSITQLSMWVKLVSDNQVIATLQNSTATAISVVAGVLTFGGSLTVSAISVDGSTVSAATAGATLNDNAWHRVILTMTSISCSNVKLLTNSSAFGSVQISDVQFIGSTTKTFPLQEGPGTSNTNRDRYWIGSDGTSGVVSNADVSGTVANINANYCPYARDWCMENGGGVAVNGAFIPGRIGTGLDALGNAKTLAAGKHGNPYSLLVRNPWSAPELVNIGMPSSNKIAPSVDVQAASVVDTQFNRILSTGSDRYLAYRQALTGADKTNTEGYTT